MEAIDNREQIKVLDLEEFSSLCEALLLENSLPLDAFTLKYVYKNRVFIITNENGEIYLELIN